MRFKLVCFLKWLLKKRVNKQVTERQGSLESLILLAINILIRSKTDN